MLNLTLRAFKKNLKNPESFLIPTCFFVLTCFVFGFSASDKLEKYKIFGYSVTLTAILFSYCLSLKNFFEKDYETGVLQFLYVNNKSKISIILSQIFCTFFIFTISLTFVLPMVSMFFNIDINIELFLVIVLSNLVLSLVSVNISSIIIGAKNGAILATILCLPLFLPILIVNLSFLENISGLEKIENIAVYVKNISALCLIYFPLCLITSSYSLKIACED